MQHSSLVHCMHYDCQILQKKMQKNSTEAADVLIGKEFVQQKHVEVVIAVLSADVLAGSLLVQSRVGRVSSEYEVAQRQELLAQA